MNYETKLLNNIKLELNELKSCIVSGNMIGAFSLLAVVLADLDKLVHLKEEEKEAA